VRLFVAERVDVGGLALPHLWVDLDAPLRIPARRRQDSGASAHQTGRELDSPIDPRTAVAGGRTYADGDILLRLEMLSGVTVMGHAKEVQRA